MLKKLFSVEQPTPEPPKRGASATVYKKTEQPKNKMAGWFGRVKKAQPTAKTDTPTAKQNSTQLVAEHSEGPWWNRIDGDWWVKPATILTALMVFVVLMSNAYGSLYNWLDQPVEQVIFTGNTQHLDRQQIAAKSVALMNGGLLSADIQAVKAGIQVDPWVYQVGVGRRWPASLYLTVTEEVPIARWGEDGLLNHEGDIFWPDDVAKYSALPRLRGPSSNTGMMMSEYYDLNQMLRNTGLRLVELKLEARGAWTLLLDNGIRVVVGRDQVVARLERFLTIYQQRLQAEADAGRIEQIDIRYNNGIAVKWRPLAATDEQQKG